MIAKIAIFFVALSASALSSAGQCRPIEYQELKDMKTSPLRDMVVDYLKIHQDNLMFPKPGSLDKAEQCESEIKRMVEVLKSRKDLMKVRKTEAMGIASGDLYRSKYESIIGQLE